MALSKSNLYVKVKVSQLEKQFIDKYCHAFDVSLSEYCHLAILKSILAFETIDIKDIATDLNTIKEFRKKGG